MNSKVRAEKLINKEWNKCAFTFWTGSKSGGLFAQIPLFLNFENVFEFLHRKYEIFLENGYFHRFFLIISHAFCLFFVSNVSHLLSFLSFFFDKIYIMILIMMNGVRLISALLLEIILKTSFFRRASQLWTDLRIWRSIDVLGHLYLSWWSYGHWLLWSNLDEFC